MNILDMRTVLFSYVLTNAICLMVAYSLWSQSHKRFPGLGFWLIDFVAQFLAIFFIALRNIIPDWISVLLGNPLILFGTLALYMGLERYLGKQSSQRFNFILVSGFALAHAYFTFVQPNLHSRNLIFSMGLLVLCAQCVWLLLHRVNADVLPETRSLSTIFILYCVISIARFIEELMVPQGNDIFTSGPYATLAILLYQILFIALTFFLFLMVNRRLFTTLEHEIMDRKQAQEKIQVQNLRLKVLREIDTAILSAESMEGIVQAALSHVQQLLGCRRASLSLFDWETNEAAIFDVRTIGETSVPKGTRMPLTLFQDMVRTLSMDQPILIQDLGALPDPPPQIRSHIGDGLRSMCLLRLFSQTNRKIVTATNRNISATLFLFLYSRITAFREVGWTRNASANIKSQI